MWKSKTSSELSIEFQYLVDKYGSTHIGRRTNGQANIGGTYGQMRTDGVYRREGTNGVGSDTHNPSRFQATVSMKSLTIK